MLATCLAHACAGEGVLATCLTRLMQLGKAFAHMPGSCMCHSGCPAAAAAVGVLIVAVVVTSYPAASPCA